MNRSRGIGIFLLVIFCGGLAGADPQTPIEIVCHRGANEKAPENTMASAQICVDWDVEWVEIDVRTSSDGVMFLMHDRTVDRTTDGTGPIAEMTADQIDALDAGSWFGPKFAGERVPRLRPFMEWAKGKIKVYLDVKDAPIAELVALIHEIEMEADVFFWFDKNESAEKFREISPDLPLKINAYTPQKVRDAVAKFDCQIIEMRLPSLTPELVKTCRELGQKVMVRHGKNDPDAFREIIKLGADMINLDHADSFLLVRGEELYTTTN